MAYFQGRTVSFRECILGMVIPPLIGNPYNGQINPYCWVDDPPLLYGKQLFPGYLFFLWVWELNVTKQGLFRTSGEGWMDSYCLNPEHGEHGVLLTKDPPIALKKKHVPSGKLT